MKVKTDPVVTDAKPVLGRVDTLEPFHVSGAGTGEALDCLLTRRAIPLSSAAMSSRAVAVHSIRLTPDPSSA